MFWALINALAWRPLRLHAWRAVASIVAVALGIAVVIGIRLASRAALDSFRTTATAIAGDADLVAHGPTPIPAAALTRLRPLSAWAEISPYIDRIVYDPRGQDTLEMVGRDWLAAGAAGAGAFQPEKTAQPRTAAPSPAAAQPPLPPVVLTEKYAAQHNYRRGDRITVVAAGRMVRLQVAALLPDRGIARAQQGNLALVELATAEEIFFGAAGAPGGPAVARAPAFDGLQITLAPGADAAAVGRELAAALPGDDVVEPPAARARQADKMLAAFHANLLALSYVSLLVGGFLIYNTMTMAVLRQRSALAVARALGAQRRGVLAATLSEAAALCCVGAAGGLGLGWLLARGSLRMMSATVNNLYVVNHPAPLRLTAADGSLALSLALALGILAAIGPARAAASVAPAAALRPEEHELAYRRHPRRWAAAAGSFAAAAVALALLPSPFGLPVFGYGAAFAAVMAAAFAAPLAVRAVLGPAHRRLLAKRQVVAGLAAASLLAAQRRTAIVTAALATAVAMLIGVAVMVGSFRQTVRVWVNQTLEGDVFLRAADFSREHPAPIPAALAARIVATPGVAQADFYYAQPRTFAHDEIEVATRWRPAAHTGGAPESAWLTSNVLFLQPPATGAAPRVLASEPFARRFHRWRGDWITLPTPAGPQRLRIDGVFYDYSSSQGILRLDLSLYRRCFGPPPIAAIALTAPPHLTAQELRRRVALRAAAGDYALLAQDNAALKRGAMAVFDQTFRITYALEAIALLVALLGVASTLWAVALERRRELALLRFLGAEQALTRALLVAEAGWIGLLALGLGAALGAALAAILIWVVNVQSFGWTIQLHLPVAYLMGACGLIYAATLAAGWAPARLIARMDPLRALAAE